jgi:nucleoside-diphosphate-sugar epimerase
MQVLLTGATGLIGSAVLDCLVARGEAVRTLVLPDAVDQLRYRDRLEVLVGRLTDSDMLAEATKDVEVVYHIAQLFPAPSAALQDLRRVNVHGTENLLRASVMGVRRFVFLSSVLVYSPVPWPSSWPITEDFPRRAHGNAALRNYGQSKIEAEDLVLRLHCQQGLEYAMLRPTVVYGPGAWFVEQLLRQLVSRPWLAVAHGAQLGVMQWVHVSDLAEAVVLAGTSPRAANEVFNIAGREALTMPDVAAAVRELIGPFARLDRTRSQGRARGKSSPKFSIEKAQTVLGYTPQVQFPEGLDEILAAMEHRQPHAPHSPKGSWRGPESASSWRTPEALYVP